MKSLYFNIGGMVIAAGGLYAATGIDGTMGTVLIAANSICFGANLMLAIVNLNRG